MQTEGVWPDIFFSKYQILFRGIGYYNRWQALYDYVL